MESKTKKKNSSSIPGFVKFAAVLVVALFVGSSFDAILAFFGISFDDAQASAWVLVPILILSFLFVLSFHEAGHILGGKLVGFRFLLFVVGPVKIYSTESGLRVGPNRSLAMAGGLGGAAPTDSRNLARRMMAYVAGGPLASLVLAVIFLTGASVAPPSVGLVLGITAMTSLLIGVVTLVPNRTGGFVSDGARLLMLLRGNEEAERWAAMSALGGTSMAGIRPRDLDKAMIGKSLSPADGSTDEAGARSTAHYHFLDLGDLDRAESVLEPALDIEAAPEMTRSQVLLESAFLHAYFRRNPEKARDLFERSKPDKVLDKALPLRVEAAILLAEGDADGAKEKARQSLDMLGKSLVAGTAKLEREWLEGILAGETTDARREPRAR